MKLKKLALPLLAVAAFTALGGCGRSEAAAKARPLQIVASVDFYGEAAKAVAGKFGSVTSVIDDPSVDPHDYEPTTAVGKKVAQADVVIENGAGYDSWMAKLTRANQHKQVVSMAKLVGVKPGENEHIWYQPEALPKLTADLARRFGKLDPKHKKRYLQNAAAYQAKLKPLAKLIAQLKAGAKGQQVAVSEPVFDNALLHLGYKVSDNHFAHAIEAGSDPSPKDIQQLDAAIAGKKLAFFVLNTQVESRLVDQMASRAKKAGIPVLAVTETLPKGQTYISWMLGQYRDLEKIQQQVAR